MRFPTSNSPAKQPPSGNSDNGNNEIYDANTLIFGRRNRMTIENRISFNYSFNNKMFFTISVRHYRGSVNYLEFYNLDNQGSLGKIPSGSTAIVQYITNNHRFNNNYNIFNVDAVYSWRFAPGSEFNIIWKSAGNAFDRYVVNNYLKNFNHTIAALKNNSISLKVLYYIDYLQLKMK